MLDPWNHVTSLGLTVSKQLLILNGRVQRLLPAQNQVIQGIFEFQFKPISNGQVL